MSEEAADLRRALVELATASELIRQVDQLLDNGGDEAPDDDVAGVVLDRYLAALEAARRLGRRAVVA